MVTDRRLEEVGFTGPDASSSARPGAPSGPAFQSGPDRVYHLSAVGSLFRRLTCVRHDADEAQVIDNVAAAPRAVLAVGFTADPVPRAVACTETQVQTAKGGDASAASAPTGTVDMWGTGEVTTDFQVATPLLYAESSYPGWKVDLDGRSAPLLRIDHALMGVVVPAGHHTAIFSYRPTRLGTGAAISGSTLTVLCALVVVGKARRSVKRGAADGAADAPSRGRGATNA